MFSQLRTFSCKNKFSLKKVLFIGIVLYLIPKKIFIAPYIGIDPSWMLSLNMAIKEGFIWGRDIVFTFGPLGYLSTGLPVYSSPLLIFLFYLFISVNGIYFIYYLFKRVSEEKELIFITTILLFNGSFLFLRDSITLYFFALFSMFHFLKHKHQISLFLVSIFCLLAFFIKTNTGIVLNFLFLFFIIYIFFFAIISRVLIALILLGHFITLLILSYFLNVDFIPYVLNSFSIINSYNDAMGIEPHRSHIFIAGCTFLLIVLPFLRSLKGLLKSTKEMLLFLNIVLFYFIIFKQGFVRADAHVNVFFLGVSFIAILAFLFSSDIKTKNLLYYTTMVVCMFSLSGFSGSRIGVIRRNLEIGMNRNDVSKEIATVVKLPDSFLREIADRSVDVLWYENSFVYFNKLKYNPRPIIQSYSAFDSKLINLNYAKYSGETAPDFVLYHFGSIDQRHPFWDEPKIYLSLFSNYSIFDTIPKTENFIERIILFRKNNTNKNIRQEIVMDTTLRLNSSFVIPRSDNLLYLMADVEYTFIGKIRRLIFQPSLLYMTITYEDQEQTNHRMVIPVMESGVPINKKVMDFNQAYTFFSTFGKDNTKATSFKLEGNPKWFSNSVRIKFVEYYIGD